MEFSWSILGLVLFGNTLFCAITIFAQDMERNLPVRHSLIPGTRQKFLYLQDFWTMTLGDWIAIPLIFNAFVHLAVKDISNFWWSTPFMVISATAFFKMCMGKNHKPDYGFPDIGIISTAGILHLFYFGVAVGGSVICIWNLCIGELSGPVMWTALAGAIFYIGCFVLEVRSGNFDPLKIELVR